MSFCVSHEESTSEAETVGEALEGAPITSLGVPSSTAEGQSWRELEYGI